VTAEKGATGGGRGDEGTAGAEAPGSQGAERPPGGASGPSGLADVGCPASAEIDLVNLEVTAAEGKGPPVAGEAADMPTVPPVSRKDSGLKNGKKKAGASSQPGRAAKRGHAGQRGRAPGPLEPSAVGVPSNTWARRSRGATSMLRSQSGQSARTAPLSLPPPL